jgi:hypothetical protein
MPNLPAHVALGIPTPTLVSRLQYRMAALIAGENDVRKQMQCVGDDGPPRQLRVL